MRMPCCCIGERDRDEILKLSLQHFENSKQNKHYNNKEHKNYKLEEELDLRLKQNNNIERLLQKQVYINTIRQLNTKCIKFILYNIISQFQNNYSTSYKYKKKTSKLERIKKETQLIRDMFKN